MGTRVNADAVFDIDFNRFVNYQYANGGLVTLFTHPNSHPYDSGVIVADENGTVKQWLTKEDIRPKWYKNRVIQVFMSLIRRFLICVVLMEILLGWKLMVSK